MNTVEKLTFWVYANEQGDTSKAWSTLVDYYALINIDLTTAMYQICGSQSLIQFVVQEQKQVLLNTLSFDQHVNLDEQYMTQIQWGQNSVLGDETLMMMGVPVLESMGEPVFDDIFVAYPEFGTYLKQRNLSELNLSNAQVEVILEKSTDSYQTLLNPDNMRAFYKQYEEGAYSNLFTRFGFTSNEQCDQFYNYLNFLVTDSLQQGNPLENSAMGELVERTLNQTYAVLNRTFSLEVVVRNMAQNIYSSAGQLSCEYYLQQASPSNYTAICANYDFSDVEQIKTFVNATWYRNDTAATSGGYYTDMLQNATGMTDAEVTTLYDTSVSTSFGSYVVKYCGLVSVHYACADAANCTGKELADMQWG